MPIQSIIRGLANRGLAFPEIAQIRKGTRKQQTASGGETMGKDLDYFRVEFAEGEDEAAKRFLAAFGPQPKEFIALIPFKEIDRCWDYWREAYVRASGKAGGMLIHRCNGEYVNFARDPKTKEITVMDWKDKEGRQVACDIHQPVYAYTRQDGKKVEVFCKQTGRLRLIIPQLGRLAYVMLHTTSWYDVANITGNLEAISKLREDGDVRGIPLFVRRRSVERNTPYGRKKFSLIFIEADPTWVQRMLSYVQANALPDGEIKTLPSPSLQDQSKSQQGGAAPDPEWGDEEEQETGYEDDIPEEFLPPQPKPQPETFSAEAIRSKVAMHTGSRQGKLPNEAQKGLALRMLAECFAPADEDQRREMRGRTTRFLFGTLPSEMTGPQLLAILDWLKPSKGDDGVYRPSDEGAKEARTVEKEQLKLDGQEPVSQVSAVPTGNGARTMQSGIGGLRARHV